MTIIHVIPNLNAGGAEYFLVSLSSHLKNYCKQIIYTFDDPSNDLLFSKIDSEIWFIHKKNDLIQHLKNDNNSLIISWMYPSIFYIEKLLFLNKINIKRVWNIRHSNFTKFQIKQKIGILFLGILSRLINIKIIYCALASKRYHESYLFNKKNGKAILNGLIREIPFSKKTDVEVPYFLYIGRYNLSKGPDILLRIFEKYSKMENKFILKIVGSNWNKNHLTQKIKNRVELLGNQEDLSELYSNSSALLFTSRTEGYPNVLAEACSFGIPIIATNAGDAKIILKDYPHGNIVSSEKNFIIKLRELNIPDFRKRKKAGEDFRNNHRFSKTVENYLEFLSE